MFYDVTLLTGADVKTFQGSMEEKSLHQEKKEQAHLPCVCVCVGVCRGVLVGEDGKKISIYRPCMWMLGSFDPLNSDFVLVFLLTRYILEAC